MNAARQRAILAAQKVRLKSDPAPGTKLTADERRAIYAPKSATAAPEHLRGGEWVKAWRTVERITYGLTAFSALIFGGLIVGESKKSVRQ